MVFDSIGVYYDTNLTEWFKNPPARSYNIYNIMFDLRAWQLPAVRRTWRRSWSSWRSLRRSRMINRFMHANCQCLMRRTDDVTRLRDVAVKCCYIVRMYNVHEVYLANGLVQQITVKPVSTITPPSLNRKRPKDVFSSIGGGRGG